MRFWTSTFAAAAAVLLSPAAGGAQSNGAAPAAQPPVIATGSVLQPAGIALPSPAPVVPVDWLFAFKMNAAKFPSTATDRPCPFGGAAQTYKGGFSQAYAAASSVDPVLRDGAGLIGTSGRDPLAATYAAIWNGGYNFVVWNDQFYQIGRAHV